MFAPWYPLNYDGLLNLNRDLKWSWLESSITICGWCLKILPGHFGTLTYYSFWKHYRLWYSPSEQFIRDPSPLHYHGKWRVPIFVWLSAWAKSWIIHSSKDTYRKGKRKIHMKNGFKFCWESWIIIILLV